MPARHRCRAGVGVLADDCHLVPAHRLHAGDNADVLALGLEIGTLLDVQFEKCRKPVVAATLRAAIADLVEGDAEGFAAAIGAGAGPVAAIDAGEHTGSDHRWREAGAFLVGPIDDFDWREGFIAGAMQRAQSLQRGEHAERAVEFAAGRLGVEMAPHGNRRNIGALTGTPREHRAHVVDGDHAAERLRLRLEPVAPLAVELGQRQPTDAAFRRRADLGGQHQVVPQPLRVDT